MYQSGIFSTPVDSLRAALHFAELPSSYVWRVTKLFTRSEFSDPQNSTQGEDETEIQHVWILKTYYNLWGLNNCSYNDNLSYTSDQLYIVILKKLLFFKQDPDALTGCEMWEASSGDWVSVRRVGNQYKLYRGPGDLNSISSEIISVAPDSLLLNIVYLLRVPLKHLLAKFAY